MLYTNLKHIESAAEHAQIINANEKVVIVCGSMGPMCVPVYRIAEELEAEYTSVKFYDMELENPESDVIRALPDIQGFRNIPFIIWYKNGRVVQATSGLQTKTQLSVILDQEYSVILNA
jgi:thioredoxin 1